MKKIDQHQNFYHYFFNKKSNCLTFKNLLQLLRYWTVTEAIFTIPLFQCKKMLSVLILFKRGTYFPILWCTGNLSHDAMVQPPTRAQDIMGYFLRKYQKRHENGINWTQRARIPGYPPPPLDPPMATIWNWIWRIGLSFVSMLRKRCRI